MIAKPLGVKIQADNNHIVFAIRTYPLSTIHILHIQMQISILSMRVRLLTASAYPLYIYLNLIKWRRL